MASDRRYQHEEVDEIFQVAASSGDPSRRELSSTDGLTLAELQEIGREVGVSPERIAEAAAALDRRRGGLPRQRSLGMPIGVARSVDLPRAPTDREWELLVADLRETFQAQGREQSRGNLRQWTNGNLHALIEPTEAGYRLRLGTTKDEGVAVNTIGIAMFVMSVMFLFVLVITGQLADDFMVPIMLGGLSGTAFAYNAIRLPGWARQREEQMEYIAQRAQKLIGAPGAES